MPLVFEHALYAKKTAPRATHKTRITSLNTPRPCTCSLLPSFILLPHPRRSCLLFATGGNYVVSSPRLHNHKNKKHEQNQQRGQCCHNQTTHSTKNQQHKTAQHSTS